MALQAAQEGSWRRNRAAVAGQQRRSCRSISLSSDAIVRHRAIRWCDDGRRPCHDMIAGEQQSGAVEREGGMIGRIPASKLQPAVAGNRLAVGECPVGDEVGVAAAVERVQLPIRSGRWNFRPA